MTRVLLVLDFLTLGFGTKDILGWSIPCWDGRSGPGCFGPGFIASVGLNPVNVCSIQ